ALGQEAAAAFIEINAPAAVTDAGDVMPEVVANDRAWLLAQGVNAAHVAQDWAVAAGFDADVVDVVELDEVVGGEGGAVAPGPADGDAGVIKIVNEIVGDAVAG